VNLYSALRENTANNSENRISIVR